MIKKIMMLIMALVLITAVAAIPIPMPVVFYFTYNNQPVTGLDVTLTYGTESITRTTNENGGIGIDVSEGSPDFELAKTTPYYLITLSIDYGESKSYSLATLDSPYVETIALDAQETKVCPDGTVVVMGAECPTIPPEPDPEPEPTVEDKVSSNADNTIALIDVEFGQGIDVVIKDNKLAKLFDGEIDFDSEDYDVHEEIRLKGKIVTSIDDVDLGLDAYFRIEEGDIQYRYVFDDVLPLSTIDTDEELEINFLGEDIEIIHLSSDKMTIRHGEIYLNIKEGESVDYGGLPLTIGVINDDYVYVTYNGESEKIYEDEIGELGGIQVYVDEAVPNEDGDDLASIRIAEDIEEVIDDGDEYNEDWDYIIGDGYIGITNSKDYRYIDEETKPLKLGDKIVIPNDFATIKINEVTTSDLTEIDIKIREDYFEIKGNRDDSFDDEYDEIKVTTSGIYDEDDVLISTSRVRLGESDVYLELGSIKIGDLTIEFDFLDILFKGISYATKDDNYLTHSGLIFKNPEDSANDKDTFEIIIPDEVPEMTITIGAESETVGIEPEPVVCPITSECTEEECISTVCPPVVSCPPEKTCQVCEDCPETDGNTTAIIAGILAFIGGASGMYFLKRGEIAVKGTGVKIYTNRKGERTRQHRHPGIQGYHEPLTIHRVVKERHPKGQLDPEYKKDDSGEWAYVR